jgi:hypothetical protein
VAIPLLYSNFSQGLNTKSAPYLLDEGLGSLPSRDLSNVQGTVAGAIVKRNGLVTLATPATALTSLTVSEATPTNTLVGATGTTLVSVTSGGTVTSIKTGVTSNVRWEFISAPVVSGQGPVYGVNGADTPQQWSGATAGTACVNWTNASGAVAVPNGKYCIYANNQAFITGVTATPSRVFWSALADPTNWDPASLTGAGFADFDPNDGQSITAIGKVGPYILVAKPRKLWVIADTGTATIRRISDQVGCVAHRTMQSGPNGTYFLSEDRGVYLTNGTKLEPISDIITPTIDAIDGQRTQAAGAYFNGHYYLSVAGQGSGANDTTLDWDTTLNSWWRHSFGSNQFATWHPTGSAQLYSAKATAAIVDQCFAPGVNTDNGANFQWVWRGPWQSPSFFRRRLFPTPYYRKRLRQMRFDGAGTVDVSLAKDFAVQETMVRPNVFASTVGTLFGGSQPFGGPQLFGGGGSVQRNRINNLGVANAFSVVFSSTSATADIVDSYLLIMHDRKDGVVGT